MKPWPSRCLLIAVLATLTGCQSMNPAKPRPLGQAKDSQTAIEKLAGKSSSSSPSWSERLMNPFQQLGQKLTVSRPTDRPHDQLSLDVPVNPDGDLYLGAAEYALAQGKLDEAEEMFSRVPKKAEFQLPVTIGLARIAIQRNQFDDAETLYRGLLPEHADSALLQNDLGMLADRRGRLEEAVRYYRQAIELAPDSQRYRNNLADALVRLGQTDTALGVLSSQSDAATAHLTLASLLQRYGDTEKATHHWKLAQIAAQRLPDTHPVRAYLQSTATARRVADRPTSETAAR